MFTRRQPQHPRMRTRFLASVVLWACAACAKMTYIAPITAVTGIDFTDYTKQGFMFTTQPYGGKYESIGIITVTMYPEGHLVKHESKAMAEEESWEFSPLNVQDVLREAHARAKAMGANAIINFSVRAISRTQNMVAV